MWNIGRHTCGIGTAGDAQPTIAASRSVPYSLSSLASPSLGRLLRLLAWNLNHRAARRNFPDWVAEAVCAEAPDVAVFTEYVEGPRHNSFLAALSAQGLRHASVSFPRQRQNQVLIASREPHVRGGIEAPPIHPAVPPNALHVRLAQSGVDVLGFRMPAFAGRDSRFKRVTWNWLLEVAASLRSRRAIIAGDFNTAPGDSDIRCGDCLYTLVSADWRHARAAEGHSWRGGRSDQGRVIDHAFLSPSLGLESSVYSWSFHRFSANVASRCVGIPDHAMLLVTYELA